MIVKKKEADSIVFDYQLKEFPLVVSKPANDFVNQQTGTSSDFKIDALAAEQSGMHELQRQSLEKKVEELALERIKEIEEKAYKEAYDLGMIEGTDKAFEERKADLENRLGKFDELLHTFDSIKTKLVKENEVALIKILYMVAEKIALKEISQDRENIINVIMKIVEDVQSDDRMVLYINPADKDFVAQMIERGGSDAEIFQRIKLEETEKVDQGGCSLETNFGTIDASIKQRVTKVWEALMGKTPRLTDHKIDLQTDEPKEEPKDDSKDESED